MSKITYTAAIAEIERRASKTPATVRDAAFQASGASLQAIVAAHFARPTTRVAATTTRAKVKPAHVTRTAKAPTPKATPARKVADPAKAARWAEAIELCNAQGVDAKGPNGGPTPEFWALYRTTRVA